MRRTKTLSTLLALLALGGCVSAPPPQLKPERRFAGPGFIAEQSRIVAPFAHVEFCVRVPGDCRNAGQAQAVAMTSGRWDDLQALNSTVNSEITPRKDSGDDTWTLSPASGDCEDYAVTKRHMLIQRGWPSSALRLALGKTAAGEGHLVLVVRTTKGDVVLDNLSDDIPSWRETDLSWLSIQSSTDPRIWFRI
jgi:predicted transglutaminase-like cysteine proteinase